MSNDFKPSEGGVKDYIDLNVDATLSYAEGRLMWDKVNDCVVIYNSETGVALQVGQELWRRAVNNTGSTITNGSIVYINGNDITTELPTIGLANASVAEKALSTIAVSTHDVETGTIGFFTRIGTVRGLDTSLCSAGDKFYLSTVDGEYTTTAPETPNYLVSIGNCSFVSATDGTIEVDINVFNNKQNATDIFNGCIQDKADVTVSSDGTTITLSIEKSGGGGDLVLYFNNIPELFDCTPAKTVTLTAGSDISPVENFVYIPESTKVLTTGSAYPSEQYIAIARVICGSATGVQNSGAYKFHVYTDALKDENGQGHVQHVNAKFREQFASYVSGVSNTVTKVTNAGAIDNLYWSNSAGEVWQLHPHSFPARDTQVSDHLHVINDFTTKYNNITDLSDISLDTTGSSLRSNNTCYSLVIWGAVAETSGDSQLFVNAPSGSYANVADATNDSDNYSTYSIPTDYVGVGFLIARVILRYQTADSGTFDTVTVEDLRGQVPNTTAGGGGSSGGSGITPVWGGRDAIPYTNSTNDNLIFDSGFTFNRSVSNNEVTMDVAELTPIADASAPTHVEGYIYYNSDYDTYTAYPDITTDTNFRGIFIGKMQFMHIYNDTGSTLSRGRCVAWNSAFSTVLPTVVLADSDLHDSNDIAGIVIKDITTASSGIICTGGWLVKTDLDYIVPSPSAGNTLYLSSTAGELDTSVPSTGNQIAVAKYLNTSGTEHNIFIRILPIGGSGGGTEFSDAEFRVQDNTDDTKELAFECSGITTGTTQTVTIPDDSGTMTLNGATQELTNKTITSPVINTSVSGTAILDEDDMASDSNTKLATQQSIKAYVDTEKLSGYSIPQKNALLELDSTTPDEKVNFTADIFVAGTYRKTSLSITADNTVSGAGGLDTGTLQANKWYSVLAIYKPSTNTWNSLLTIYVDDHKQESSNLPTDYTVQRHVGWVSTDSTSDFEYAYSAFDYQPPFTKVAKASSITSDNTDRDLDLKDLLPPSATFVKIYLRGVTGTTNEVMVVYPDGDTLTNTQVECRIQTANIFFPASGFVELNSGAEKKISYLGQNNIISSTQTNSIFDITGFCQDIRD